MVDQSSAVTDSSGRVKINVNGSFAPGPASIKVSIGRAQGVSHDLYVGVPAGQSPLAVENRLLIGDNSTASPIPYERYDGQILDLPTKVSLDVTVKGTAGEAVTLDLGTPAQPNVEPIVAFHLGDGGASGSSEIGADALGLHHAMIQSGDNLTVRHFYDGRPGDSVAFNGSTYLETALSSKLFSKTAFGFRADYHNDGSSTGDVFKLGNSLVKLESDSDGRLKLRYKADGQSHSLSTVVLDQAWHSVAAVFENGTMALYIDDALQDQATHSELDIPAPVQDLDTGALSYENLTLKVGEDLKATLDNVELYNPESAPLLAFADGSTTKALTLTTSSESLRVHSTGKLNSGQTGASLISRSVKVASSAGTAHYINLMSTDSYRDFAGAYAISLYAQEHTLPDIDTASIDAILEGSYARQRAMASVSDFFISPAHAGWFGWSTDDFFDDLSTIASLALPINEIKAIWTQLGYLATDPSKFDGVELVINLMSLVTYFPVMRPLQPVVKPIKLMFTKIKKIGNPKFITSIGSVLGSAFEQLYKTGKSDKLQSIMPYMLVAVEMVDNWEAIEIMVEGIESPDDLWGWIEYFNLPEGGWDGEEVPSVAFVETETGAPLAELSILDWFVPTAQAAVTGKRLNGAVHGKALSELFAQFAGQLDPKDLTGGIKGIAKGVKGVNAQELRKLVHTKNLLLVSARVAKQGKNNFDNFMSGKSSARLPRPVLIALIAYLETEMATNGTLLNQNEHLQSVIRSKYAAIFSDILLGKNLTEENGKIDESNDPAFFRGSFLSGGAHGALFHLAALAYYDMIDELVDSEVVREVRFYDDTKDLDKGVKEKRKELRYVDILLSDESSEIWVELKSLKKYSVNDISAIDSDGLRQWGEKTPVVLKLASHGLTKKYTKYSYNKQFNIDRAASVAGAWESKNEGGARVPKVDFKWRFQQFEVKAKPATSSNPKVDKSESPSLGANTVAQLESKEGRHSIRGRLTVLPDSDIANTKMRFTTYGLETKTDTERQDMLDRIDLLNAKTALFDRLSNSNIIEDLVKEAMAESL